MSLLETEDPRDHRLALGAEGLLRDFNEAGVIEAADVHVARRVTELAGEDDESIALAVALAVRAVRGGSVCVDLTTVAELSEALTAQLASGVRHLIVDLSGLRFADSAVIRELVMADRKLKDRGGGLELANPRSAVARALSLLGVDQVIEVRDGTNAGADPER